MRFFLSSIILSLVLVLSLAYSFAEDDLVLSANELTVGQTLTIEANDHAPRRSFLLYQDGQQINTGAWTEARHAALNPQTAGEYTLTVQPEGLQPTSKSFTVYGQLTANLTVNLKTARMGEPIEVTVQTLGGTPVKYFDYSVWSGTERIDRSMTEDNRFRYIPMSDKPLTFSVTVTDSMGNSVSAVSEPVIVEKTPGITVSGDFSPVLVQGEIRSLHINAPGPWSAKAEQDCITLLNHCGDSNDLLIYVMSASDIGARSAVIRLSCMGLEQRIVIHQSGESAEESEVHLFEDVIDRISINGRKAVSELCTTGASDFEFHIDSGSSWYADTDAGFLSLKQENERLSVHVEENKTSEYRNASIYLHSGEATAVIGIAQPGSRKGADVREVLLSTDHGQAYEDQVNVRLTTDSTAQAVYLKIDQREPLVFKSEFAEKADDGIVWRLSVLMTGGGAQEWLFSAVNQSGSNVKALATVSISEEAPAFVGDAEVSDDRSQLNVLVTQSTESISTLDETGKVLHVYGVQEARIDRTVDTAGRYALWTLPLEGVLPSALSIGESQRAVSWSQSLQRNSVNEEANDEFRLYSQMDGTWRNKSYRKSSLEKSGCAIFALSHALQLMGHQEAESKPEQLAKTYAFCLVDGGTLNATLIGNAGKQFGYQTRYKLYNNKKDIIKKLNQGAMFSFGIVSGHIALIDRLSSDGTMCHVIDSAPSATFERMTGNTPYLYNEKSGQYVPLSSPADIPGLLYYVDTEGYDGAEYWLTLDYVADRGVRLIQPK